MLNYENGGDQSEQHVQPDADHQEFAAAALPTPPSLQRSRLLRPLHIRCGLHPWKVGTASAGPCPQKSEANTAQRTSNTERRITESVLSIGYSTFAGLR